MVTGTANIGTFHRFGQVSQCENVVNKHENFVSSCLMHPDQILASNELIRIADIEQLWLAALICTSRFQILCVEIWSHFTLHLNALDFC